MSERLVLGLGATKAPWSQALRVWARDHGQGVEVEVVMDRRDLARALGRLDVLVIDDIMRLFSPPDVAGAREAGAQVIGLTDPTMGLGGEYLARLGADYVLPASSEPAEVLSLAHQIAAPREPKCAPLLRPCPEPSSLAPQAVATRRRRGFLSAWGKVSGGAGLTECVVAAAEQLAHRGKVLVVEAEEVAPVMVSRLLRSPEGGLPWALSRARQGSPALPEGLSPPREDGTLPVGHFDVMCAAPGAPQVVSGTQLEKVVAEALTTYDHVLVELGWLVGSEHSRDRFGASRSLLRIADSVVVIAAADPEGAARLVQWRAAAVTLGATERCWAVFGRTRRGRYEMGHLSSLVEGNTGRHPFTGVRFLPEDPVVARARWNAELPWKGPWLAAVRALASSVTTAAPSPRAAVAAFRREAAGAPPRSPGMVARAGAFR
jgi:hypothetical protein